MALTTYTANPAVGATQDALGGLTRIYEAIQAILPGVTLPLLRLVVFDTIQEFCERACLWRQTVAWNMLAGVHVVDLNPIDDSTLASWVFRVSGLTSYRIGPPAVLIDYGDVTLARAGTALVVCKPNRLSDFKVPSQIVDQWSEGLRDGALSRLHSHLNRPWTDAKLAMFHGQRFRSQIRLAKEATRKLGDLGTLAPPYFARGRDFGWGIWAVPGSGGSSSAVDPTIVPDIAEPLINGEEVLDGGTF